MDEEDKYIYESPDGGKTVTRRKFGETEKELLEEYNEIQTWKNEEDYLDLEHQEKSTTTLELGPDTLTTSGIDYSWTTSAMPSTVTLGPATFEDYEPDLNVTVDGKERSMKDVIKQVDDISKRLKVLDTPDEKTLEKYKILADIYEQYKVADALLNAPGPEDDNEEH
tara:strand:- start:47 stop:547 length:501 start_codon:yes stop_codon:yes gene_type:complete